MRTDHRPTSNDMMTGCSGSEGLAWYPLQTRYQCEKKVDAALRDEGFESFAPMQLERRRWSDRTKLIESPLFPGYTFVRMEAEPKLLIKVLRRSRPRAIRDQWPGTRRRAERAN